MIPQKFTLNNNFNFEVNKQTLNLTIVKDNGLIETRKIDFIEGVKSKNDYYLDYELQNLIDPKKYNSGNHFVSLKNVKKIFFSVINDGLKFGDADFNFHENIMFGLVDDAQERNLIENNILDIELNYFDISNKVMEFDKKTPDIYFQKLFIFPVFYKSPKYFNQNEIKIGDFYQGGIVCDTWYENGIQKGLIVGEKVMGYEPNSLIWHSRDDVFIFDNGAYGSPIDGYENSMKIANFNEGESTLLNFIFNYSNPERGAGVYNDWFLPALFQFQSIMNNINKITETMRIYFGTNLISMLSYPTSNELTKVNAMFFNTGYGSMNGVSKISYINNGILVVRKF